MKATGAAHAHNLHLEPHDPPPNVWPSGVTKLAAATAATVVWGGDDDEEVGLQTFLQESMCEAFGVLADRLRDLEGVMGFEVRPFLSRRRPPAASDSDCTFRRS